MNPINTLPPLIQRVILMAGLLGLLMGLLISAINQDSLGWSLLRVSVMALIFSLCARWIVLNLLRTWLEYKIDDWKQKQEAARAVATASNKKSENKK